MADQQLGQRSMIVELPDELYDEAIREGIGKPFGRRRRGAAEAVDVMTVVVGLGTTAISLMQAPETLGKFWAWLSGWARKGETMPLQVRRNGKPVLEVELQKDGGAKITVPSGVESMLPCLLRCIEGTS